MKGRLMYIPPDVLKEIEKIKKRLKIKSPSEALRVLINKKEDELKWDFKI